MTSKAFYMILAIAATCLIASGVVLGLSHDSTGVKDWEFNSQHSPTVDTTLLPTTTATMQPTATEMSAKSATPENPEEIGGGCSPSDCHISYQDFGSSMRIRCGECWDGDTFHYYGEFIYEDEPDRGYHNLRNPSYEELMDFLEADKTDEIPADPPHFVCQHFSLTLRENANRQGLRCACVIPAWVPMEGGAGKNDEHAMSAFETTDRGLVHIEPQNDLEMLIVEQWQPWPCGVIESFNKSVEHCTLSGNLLYRVIYIW